MPPLKSLFSAPARLLGRAPLGARLALLALALLLAAPAALL